jgi:hypothetical protein
MAVTNFQQTIWSKAIQKELKTITSLRNHCDFQYERETKNAKELKILSVTRPTINTYVKGTELTLEGLTDSALTLKLDQYRYFNFEVEDIDKAQSVPGLMEDASRQAAIGLKEEGDKYVAKLVKAGVETTSSPLASSGAIALTKTNAVEKVEEGFAKLYEKNVPVSEPLYFEVAPKVFTIYRQALTELSTNNPEILKKGAVGKINNAYVCVENLLPTGKKTSASSSDDVVYNIIRTSKAIAFAEQIEKVEAYRPEKAFQDALKGLYVFGALITRPDEIYVLKTEI